MVITSEQHAINLYGREKVERVKRILDVWGEIDRSDAQFIYEALLKNNDITEAYIVRILYIDGCSSDTRISL